MCCSPVWIFSLQVVCIAPKQEHTHTHTDTDTNLTLSLRVIPFDLAAALLLEASTHSAAYRSAAFERGFQESVTPCASFFDFQEWSGTL